MKKLLWIIGCLALGASAALGDPASSAGTSGAAFLGIGVGARPAALGNCFVSICDDANALYWNPAGVAQLETMQLSLTQNSWLQGVSEKFLGGTYPLNADMVVGASLRMFDYGSVNGYDDQDNALAYSANNLVLAGTCGLRSSEELLLGATLKYISEKIGDASPMALGLDAGALYKLSGNLNLGAMIQNISIMPIKYVSESENLPMTVKMGLTYKSESYDFQNPNVISLALNQPSDGGTSGTFGMEYWLSNIFVARGGYTMLLGSSNDVGGSLYGLSLGFGLKYNLLGGQSIGLDLAFVPYGDLGNSTRFSVLVKF